MALFLAVRHPETPWYAKLLAAIVTAYAFSPPSSLSVVSVLPDPPATRDTPRPGCPLSNTH